MSKVLSLVFLFILVFAGASLSYSADTKTDPSQFQLSVHISGSAFAYNTPTNLLEEVITATIDGKHYQMRGPTSSAKIFSHGNGLLNPGDYHGRLSMDEHKTSYESSQQFEILFPDGTTRRFTVIAQSE